MSTTEKETKNSLIKDTLLLLLFVFITTIFVKFYVLSDVFTGIEHTIVTMCSFFFVFTIFLEIVKMYKKYHLKVEIPKNRLLDDLTVPIIQLFGVIILATSILGNQKPSGYFLASCIVLAVLYFINFALRLVQIFRKYKSISSHNA